MDLTAGFESSYELVGGKKSDVWIVPSGKGFGTTKLPCERTNNRLVIYFYPAVLKGSIDILDHIFRNHSGILLGMIARGHLRNLHH